MVKNRLNCSAILFVIGAALLDRLIGDPKYIPHPVETIGLLINSLQKTIEKYSNNNYFYLRAGGFIITIIVISLCGFTSYLIERIYTENLYYTKYIGAIIILIGLSSSLAAGSLEKSIKEVINSLPNISKKERKLKLDKARFNLAQIVGRDVDQLNESEILRATAETASENSIDGVFAPLFWMIIGASLWQISTDLPGPLCFAWIFKASSTIDSMIGYKRGTLKWLGTAGARLDDFLTWIPCRIVFLTLPIVNRNWLDIPRVLYLARREGLKDSSPNAGLSQAIYAHCLNIKMGGLNTYQGKLLHKPVMAKMSPIASKTSIKEILKATLKLEIFWLFCFLLINYKLFI